MYAPLDELFDSVGVRFVKGMANRIDEQAQTVGYTDETGQPGELRYDRLVLAAGSQLVRPTVPGMDAYAFDVDQIEAAVRLEKHLASLKDRPRSVPRNTVVVAGGGFTGIETATEMPARLRAVLGNDEDIRVIVVDRGAQIAAAMGDGIRPSIAEASEHLGIEWVLNATVSAVDADGVTLADGRRIEAATVIWTVGFRASPLTRELAGTHDAQGRLHVDQNLKVRGQDRVFAAGDVAYAATDDLGNFAVMSCQHAISLGRHAGNNAAAELLGVSPMPYHQPKYVTCLDLGAWGAVFTEGWDRQLKLVKEEAKALKTQINTLWIYPPAADRAAALAAADPLIPVA
jgi:NADH dehydrogenase